MNVHKAKGLEAEVVILAGPSGGGGHAVDLKVERDPEHGALGWLSIVERSGEGYRARKTPVAWPASWHEKEEDEGHYEAAEHERLLYVAATRARDELVVSRREGGRSRSPWALFEPWLDRHGTALEAEAADPPGVDRLDRTAGSLLEETRLATVQRSQQADPTYLFSSVTDLTKGATPHQGGRPAPVRGPPPGATSGEASYTRPWPWRPEG
jgi:ATP-dependent helicase/nuclease subunit A